jgi:hypothetical protein
VEHANLIPLVIELCYRAASVARPAAPSSKEAVVVVLTVRDNICASHRDDGQDHSHACKGDLFDDTTHHTSVSEIRSSRSRAINAIVASMTRTEFLIRASD